MSIKLTDSVRKSNPYMVEIDRVQEQVTTLNTNLTTISDDLNTLDQATDNRLDALEANVGGIGASAAIVAIQENDPFPHQVDNIVKPWSDDLVLYYDFNDPDNLARDCTGNGNHGTTQGYPKYNADPERTHALEMYNIVNNATNERNTSQNLIKLDEHINSLQETEYTISFWFNSTSTNEFNTVFSAGEKTSDQNNLAIMIFNGELAVLQKTNNTNILYWKFDTPENTWTHFAISMKPGVGNKIYINGVLDDTSYITGGSATYYDLSSAQWGSIGVLDDYQKPHTRYTFPYTGKVSDFTFWKRELDPLEVSSIYNDHYGYTVYLLAGQSNMAGYGSPYDNPTYELQEGRVFQYDTVTNIPNIIANGSSTVVSHDIIPATQNLRHPTGQLGDYGALWKTFCDDLIQFGSLPFRHKVLLIPTATGGSMIGTHWDPGQRNYNVTINACDDVLGSRTPINQLNKFHGVLWNQGESNISGSSIEAPEYKTKLMTMFDGFRTNILGMNYSTPIIIAKISSNNYDDFGANETRKNEYNVVLQELADENTNNNPATFNIEIVDTVGLTFIADDIHYDVQSLRKLGHMYYDKYCLAAKMVNKKPSVNSSMVINSKALTRNIQLLKPVEFQSSPLYSNLSINGYYSYTWNAVSNSGITQAIDNKEATFKFTKLGNICFLTLPANMIFTATNTGSLRFENVPADFRPLVKCNALCQGRVTTLGNSVLCDVDIDDDGSVTFKLNMASKSGSNDGTENAPSFTINSSCAIYPFSVSYITN